MTRGISVSVCINLHREGRLCQATIESALASMEYAEKFGIGCELILILDNPCAYTVDAASCYAERASIVRIDVRDLGKARNFGLSVASGRYCALLDGDDLFSRSWLWAAFSESEHNLSQEFIVHPRMNLFFGSGFSPYYWVHPDMRSDKITLSRLVVENLWTSLCFARKETFLDHPYTANDIANGFGYEDWSWNIRTVSAGILHVAAPGSIHFIRRKSSGSLLRSSAQERVMPDLRVFVQKKAVVAELLGTGNGVQFT